MIKIFAPIIESQNVMRCCTCTCCCDGHSTGYGVGYFDGYGFGDFYKK